jgi:YbbR domain-containing protein
MVKSRLLAKLRFNLHFIHENKWLKALSILLALTLFLLSRQPRIEVRINDVPIEFQGLPPGYEIVDEETQRVSVRLYGPEDIVRRLSGNQISVRANLQYKEPGHRVVQLHPEDVVRPAKVTVLQILPPNIRLVVERTLVRTLPIDARLEGDLAPGVEIYRLQIDPSHLSLEGPESQLEEVKMVPTETINLHGRSKSFTTLVDAETISPAIRIKTRGQIRLSITIGEERTTRTFSGIPVQWPGQGPRDRLLTRKVEVEVMGPRSRIESLTPGEIRVEIPQPKEGEGSGGVSPRVLLPEGGDSPLRVIRISPSTVQFRHPRR